MTEQQEVEARVLCDDHIANSTPIQVYKKLLYDVFRAAGCSMVLCVCKVIIK